MRDIEVNRENTEDLRTVRDTSALYIQGKGRKEKTDYVKLPAQVEQGIRDYLKTRETITTGSPYSLARAITARGGPPDNAQHIRHSKDQAKGSGL